MATKMEWSIHTVLKYLKENSFTFDDLIKKLQDIEELYKLRFGPRIGSLANYIEYLVDSGKATRGKDGTITLTRIGEMDFVYLKKRIIGV